MKTIINKVLLVTMLSLSLFACKKEGQLVTIGTSTPAVLNTSVASVTLTKPNIANVAVTATLTPADFGFSAATTNTLQIAKTGTSFATPKEVIMGTGATSISFTQLELNNLLLSMGFAPEVAGSIEMRVKSTISENVTPVYSNVKTLSATPFALITTLYLAGANNGWTFSNDSLVSPQGDGIHSGIIQFNQSLGFFKLSKTKDWANVYGSASQSVTSVLMVGPGNISNALVGPLFGSSYYAADNYNVVANTSTLEITYELMTWGITGDAVLGWPPGAPNDYKNDKVMKYNNTTKLWSITTDLVAGVFKFRKNHGWAVNLGGSAGKLTQGGGDISVTAGNYTIGLDATNNTYTLVKN